MLSMPLAVCLHTNMQHFIEIISTWLVNHVVWKGRPKTLDSSSVSFIMIQTKQPKATHAEKFSMLPTEGQWRYKHSITRACKISQEYRSAFACLFVIR